jgi:hypothetical protein
LNAAACPVKRTTMLTARARGRAPHHRTHGRLRAPPSRVDAGRRYWSSGIPRKPRAGVSLRPWPPECATPGFDCVAVCCRAPQLALAGSQRPKPGHATMRSRSKIEAMGLPPVPRSLRRDVCAEGQRSLSALRSIECRSTAPKDNGDCFGVQRNGEFRPRPIRAMAVPSRLPGLVCGRRRSQPEAAALEVI